MICLLPSSTQNLLTEFVALPPWENYKLLSYFHDESFIIVLEGTKAKFCICSASSKIYIMLFAFRQRRKIANHVMAFQMIGISMPKKILGPYYWKQVSL